MIQWNGHRVFGVLAMSRSIGMCLILLLIVFSMVIVTRTSISLHMYPSQFISDWKEWPSVALFIYLMEMVSVSRF